MSIPSTLTITGNVYIKYIEDISAPITGDILLLLNDDSISLNFKSYDDVGFSGYIKAKVYDGKIWQNINIIEFCYNKENKLIKRQRAIDSFLLCKEIFTTYSGTILYKSYRGHFTKELYAQGRYIRKAKYDKSGR